MSTTAPTRVAVKTAGQGMTFDKVSLTFPNGTKAIEEASFSIGPGEFVSVVGPSGCGKSTLLKIASGLLPATTGTMTVDAGHLGYVFQDATLMPWRTVQKNVELLGELEGMSKADRKKAAADAIELVGLKGFESDYPKSLSGGMKMRASLARALTLKPGTFLFDEPFGALDEITRERLNDELLDLFVQTQFAGLFITHSIAEAVYLSTRVLVMSGRPGRIVGDYPIPFDYPRKPELRFDQEFVDISGRISESLREAHA